MEARMPAQLVDLNATTKGYEARPEGTDPQPAVIIVHEITGLNDYAKEVAEMVAKRGFVGLAVDLFEGKTAEGMQDGLPLREKVTPDIFRDRIGAGIQYLKSRPYCTGRIGVTGFCMGGGLALLAACQFPDDLQGCSIFYGRMDNVAVLEGLRHPVIGSFGGDDAGITTWAGERLWPEMVKLGKSLDMKVYPGAPHGFARHNDERGFYRPEAAADAFERTFALFNETLRAQK
jgi:carboxymethylenebutenolidase